MPLEGIDVHDKQGVIDWQKVAGGGKKFAFVRGAYGTKQDARVEQNFSGAKRSGLACGVYHFFRVSRDFAAQAKLMSDVLKAVNFGSGDLPPVLDVEDNPAFDGEWNTADNAKYITGLKLWLARIAADFHCLPIIYTRASFWDLLGHPAGFEKYPLWVAHYTAAANPSLPKGWNSYAFWQYTDKGSADGVPGTGDLNRFSGDEAALKRLTLP